jgi:hypothetical protein
MILQKLEGFTHAIALDLNMGYHTIRLDPAASKMCIIIFPWGKYFISDYPWVLEAQPIYFKPK